MMPSPKGFEGKIGYYVEKNKKKYYSIARIEEVNYNENSFVIRSVNPY